MKFGVPLPTFRQAASPDAIRRVAERAEALGFDGVWVSDHIVIPGAEVDRFARSFGDSTGIGGLIYEPLTVLAFAAACTSRIRLGTTVLVAPYRNPLVTAQMLSTPDVLSGGRVTAGMAVGWMEEEFRSLGVPFEERSAISDEYIDFSSLGVARRRGDQRRHRIADAARLRSARAIFGIAGGAIALRGTEPAALCGLPGLSRQAGESLTADGLGSHCFERALDGGQHSAPDGQMD